MSTSVKSPLLSAHLCSRHQKSWHALNYQTRTGSLVPFNVGGVSFNVGGTGTEEWKPILSISERVKYRNTKKDSVCARLVPEPYLVLSPSFELGLRVLLITRDRTNLNRG